jgi:hypothetical protein
MNTTHSLLHGLVYNHAAWVPRIQATSERQDIDN